MNIRKTSIISFIIVLSLLVTSCTQNQNFDNMFTDKEIDISNIHFEKPLQIIMPETNDNIMYKNLHPNLAKLLLHNRYNQQTHEKGMYPFYWSGKYNVEEDKMVASSIESFKCTEKLAAPQNIDLQDAKYDITFLFNYLKYGYSGYEYLGGDEVFLPQKELMLNEIDTLILEGHISMPTYEFSGRIIQQYLYPIIEDNHFKIGEDSYMNNFSEYSNYICYDLEFFEEGEFYITTIQNTKYVLQGINISEGVRLLPSINIEGKLCWLLGASLDTRKELYSIVELVEPTNGKVKYVKVSLTLISSEYINEIDYSIGYDNKILNGIPIIQNRRLYLNDEEKDFKQSDMSLFINNASVLNEFDNVILDIRGNRGGDSRYASEWIENFTGTNCNQLSISLYSVNLNSQTARTTVAQYEDGTNNFFSSDMTMWTPLSYNPFIYIPNDTTLYVLIDSYTSSSGEAFVKMLREVDNVVIIGVPTAGCNTFGNIREIYFPYSRVPLTCGMSLFMFDTNTKTEGIGFEPDLWVSPEDSLERVIQFIDSTNDF